MIMQTLNKVDEYIEAVRREQATQQRVWDAAEKLCHAREAEQAARRELEMQHLTTKNLWNAMSEDEKAQIRRGPNGKEW